MKGTLLETKTKFTFFIFVTASLVLGANLLAANDDERLVRKDLVGTLGDTDSFGASVKWAGVATTGGVGLGFDCTPDPNNPPAPDDRCVLLGPCPTTTNFDLRDIGRITLPGNTAKTIIYPVFQVATNYQLKNTTGIPQPSGLFSMMAYFTVESNALKDPRAIDPSTGLPMNGSIDMFPSARQSVNRSLAADDRDREDLRFTRATIYAISKIAMQGNYNLPKDIVDKMFREPITIRLNLSGSARCVSDAKLSYAARFYSD
jgi:hypothetical protein